MSLDADLFAILACPQDKGPLYYFEDKDVLYNPRLGCTYEVRNRIPVMLIEERTDLDASAVSQFDQLVAERGLRLSFEQVGDDKPDTVGMRAAWEGLADQAAAAFADVEPFASAVAQMARERWTSGQGPDGTRGAGQPRNVVVAGMGGSGIAGDIVAAVTADARTVPLEVVKGYELSGYVNADTLVVAVSFSGNTEETLAVARSAHDAGAALAVVTCGGQLGELAASIGAPAFTVDETIPMPRAAVAAISIAPLAALDALGVIAGGERSLADDVAETVEGLKARTAELAARGSDAFGKPFTSRAAAFDDRLITLTAAGLLGETAAGRWKTQINENAKLPAMTSAVPELCHNELTGWSIHPAYAGAVTPVFLRHSFEHPQNRRRFEFLRTVLAEAGVGEPIEVVAQGTCALAVLFDLICVGDFFSLELAASLGRDPGPVDVLLELKSFLAQVPDAQVPDAQASTTTGSKTT